MKQYHIFHRTGAVEYWPAEHQPRVYVGFVNASSLEKAFEYAQNDHVDWGTINEVRSTCVGDVIYDYEDFYMVCSTGFLKLEEPEEHEPTFDEHPHHGC